MGDIGPTQQKYDVLPGEQFGVADADAWTAAPRATIPTPPPTPGRHPAPEPEPSPIPAPEPGPFPGPEPVPHPEPPR